MNSDAGWYCVRSKQKQEHLAAGAVRRIDGVQVFLPRLRIRRITPRGPVWFTEALFPGYLFAQLSLATHLGPVRAAPGVQSVVAFGVQPAVIPDCEMEDLRRSMNFQELVERDTSLNPGDRVVIGAGSFQGLSAVVHRVLDGLERAQVLLDILGRMSPVEMPTALLEKAA